MVFTTIVLALGMTGYLAHCLVKQARVHYGIHAWQDSHGGSTEIKTVKQLYLMQSLRDLSSAQICYCRQELM